MRKYGQDSYLTKKEKALSNSKSFSKRIKYHFENIISKGSNFVFFLIVLSFFLAILMTLIQIWMGDQLSGMYFEKWWGNVTKILKIGAGETWKARIIEFLFWIFSVAISGAVVGFITSKISELVAKLKRGKSHIIDKNHVLILGWSNSIFSIIKELSSANENVSNATIVVFSEINNQKMLDEIEINCGDVTNIKIITRNGNYTNPDDLKIVNPNEAKSIVILEREGNNNSNATTAILALGTLISNKNIPIIVSMKDAYYAKLLSTIKTLNVIPILPQKIITNVTSQACRQKGIGLVIMDFLDFEGNEIYFQEIPQLAAKTYGEALLSFDLSSVIGVIDKNDKVLLNPPIDSIINIGQKLILVSEDDDTIVYDNSILTTIKNKKTNTDKYFANQPKNILFLGWSETGSEIMNSLLQFLPEDSKVDVAYIKKYTLLDNLHHINSANNKSKVNYFEISIDDPLDFLKENKYDDVIVIGYRDVLSNEEADTFTLLQMLKLDHVSSKLECAFRVVTQLLDSGKAKLAVLTNAEELIVGDNLGALLISQLVENPKLSAVFDDLFDADGASINVFPIEKYTELDQTITYAELVYKASLINESAMGIMKENNKRNIESERLMLNPSKKTKLTPTKGDLVIVISSR